MTKIRAVLFDLGDTLVVGTKWVPGAEATLVALRGAGVRVGIISNTGTLTRHELLAELPATFTFDAFEPELVILSAEVGIEKPALAIFRLAVERVQAPAAAVLFVTETALHALAAQRVGLRALRLWPPTGGDIRDLPQLLADVEALA